MTFSLGDGKIFIENENIKEFYIFCIEAKDKGQKNIPVSIFPIKMNGTEYENLITGETNSDKVNLWSDLKKAYDFFEETKTLPKIIFLKNGRHKIEVTSN